MSAREIIIKTFIREELEDKWCANRSLLPKCETIQSLMYDNWKSSAESAEIDIQAHLVANGFCRKAFDRAMQHNRWSEYYELNDYIEDHPVFETEADKEYFRIKMEKLEDGSLYFPESSSFVNRFMEKLVEKGYITERLVAIIDFYYLSKRLTIQEIAKCVLAFDREYSPSLKKSPIKKIRKPKKDNIKSLTEEEGYNIDVEELL